MFFYLFIYLLNFNYTDLNIQIVNKLTFKMNEKLQKLQDLNNEVFFVDPISPRKTLLFQHGPYKDLCFRRHRP